VKIPDREEDETVADEMFFGPDGLSLRRGQRRDARIEACRPCYHWPSDAPDLRREGVVMNLNRHGLLVRAIEPVPVGAVIIVQLMRDDEFRQPFSNALQGTVVRNHEQRDGLFDHGIQLEAEDFSRAERRPVRASKPKPQPARRTRMHTIDFTVGERGIRRNR